MATSWPSAPSESGGWDGPRLARKLYLTVLRVRGIVVADVDRERILAERDPARLARWHERAILAEVLAEPIRAGQLDGGLGRPPRKALDPARALTYHDPLRVLFYFVLGVSLTTGQA